ncbi:hypothetical protein HPB50_002787 [Hyalomma asiaticum]|uniref:Uncharacterized protein n=1 Tax=Hyalomma asiaticum TaxID=266040 RepID=A0ACB7S6P9_HYAAI|nr:hypothetical protein HPB50_002787 [Hyalomma asiaticum]
MFRAWRQPVRLCQEDNCSSMKPGRTRPSHDKNVHGSWKRHGNTSKRRDRKRCRYSEHCSRHSTMRTGRQAMKLRGHDSTANSQLRGSTNQLQPCAPSIAGSPDQGASAALPKPRPGADILERVMATALPYGAFSAALRNPCPGAIARKTCSRAAVPRDCSVRDCFVVGAHASGPSS